MENYFIPDPLKINDSFSDEIFCHFDKLIKDKKKHRFILSISGGSDSILLLFLFINYLKGNEDRLVIGHINHHLRPDSDVDESFVSILGEKLNIKTYIKNLNINDLPKGYSVEAWARESRYDYLKSLMIKTNADWIVTAHHANDQAETILMNISEKTGLFGLGGMKEINNKIIRPLLPFSKDYLMGIIEKYSIPYVIDSSNNNINYKRNFIRNVIIDPWQKNNLNLIDAFTKAGNNFQEWQESILYFTKDFIVKNSLENKDGSFIIRKTELKKLPKLARAFVFQVLTNSIGQLRKHEIENIKNFFDKDIIGNKYLTKNKYIIINDRKVFIIKKNKRKKKKHIELTIGTKCKFYGYDYTINNFYKSPFFSNNPDDEYIDLNKILNKKLVLRLWKSGDRFKPLGMSGSQKISDFLINNKLNFFEKNSQVVLTANGKVIWLCGYRIDDSVKINNNTTSIIRINRILNSHL